MVHLVAHVADERGGRLTRRSAAASAKENPCDDQDGSNTQRKEAVQGDDGKGEVHVPNPATTLRLAQGIPQVWHLAAVPVEYGRSGNVPQIGFLGGYDDGGRAGEDGGLPKRTWGTACIGHCALGRTKRMSLRLRDCDTKIKPVLGLPDSYGLNHLCW